ncbi:F-box protein At3g07870-like [Papaver somniferum]|uniref:F-box protein At3g07870-like n=1 Tax=Papaver somniferum TaxID=3469 RepID=UPI000E6FDEB3|nr:F-box protein At3g07870-like [Papaver somniferum]
MLVLVPQPKQLDRQVAPLSQVQSGLETSNRFITGYEGNDSEEEKLIERDKAAATKLEEETIKKGRSKSRTKSKGSACPPAKEYINLPRLKDNYGYVVSGFGYHPKTNKYKVIQICYPDIIYNTELDTKGFVEVYTLGSGTRWRSIREITYQLYKRGVLANGSVYWLDYQQKKIVAFDIADEEFRWLPTVPQCFHGRNATRYMIKVLVGVLFLVHCDEDQPMDIWAYKRKQKDGDDNNDEGHCSSSWNLEFSIPWSILRKVLCEPFAEKN